MSDGEKKKATREAVIQVQLEAIHWLAGREQEHLRRALIKALDAIDECTSNPVIASGEYPR